MGEKSEEIQRNSEDKQQTDEVLSDVFSEIGINMDSIMNISEDAEKAFDAEPEVLISLPHDRILEELRVKQKEIGEAFDKIIEIRNKLKSKIKEERSHRDEYNSKVKEIAMRIRELNEKRNELQSHIQEKKKELDEMRKLLREINEKLDSLQRDIEGFSLRKERRLRAQIRKYEVALETFNLPPEIEERIIKKIKQLAVQLKGFKEKEEKWREMSKLKKERERLRDSIGALRKALVLYIQELRKVKSEIRELRKERDHYKAKADQYHEIVQKYSRKLEEIKNALDELRDLRYKIVKTLDKVRRLKQQMRHFRAEEEFKNVVIRRLTEIKARIERGELEMPDLQFLINFGFLTEDIFEKITTSSPQELAKKVAEELGYK